MLSGGFSFMGWHVYCSTIIAENYLGGSKNGEVGIHVF